MRKALLTIPSATGLLLLSVQLAFATPPPAPTTVTTCPQAPFDVLCNFTSASFGPIVGVIVTMLFIIAVVVALLFLIWGGIRWITSGGDKAQVETARNHIVAAIVGLIIVLLAYFVIQIVLGLFGLSVGSLTLPTFTIH